MRTLGEFRKLTANLPDETWLAAYAKGRQKVAERMMREALDKAQKKAEPRLKELKTEIVKLRKALAYHYLPTHDETISWMEHCNQISSAGGAPPDKTQWWAFVALSHWEFSA
jgi:hypothetical protein